MSEDLDELYKYCPVCHRETSKEIARYHKIVDGVFRSSTLIVETTYSCKYCGWSVWFKEEVKE